MTHKEESTAHYLAREHLRYAAQILAAMDRTDTAAEVERLIARELPVEEFEDGLYRILGVPWQRKGGQWFRMGEVPSRVLDEEMKTYKPVRIREVTSEQVVFNLDDLPTASDLRALLHSSVGISVDQHTFIARFIGTLQHAVDEKRAS